MYGRLTFSVREEDVELLCFYGVSSVSRIGCALSSIGEEEIQFMINEENHRYNS